MTNNNAAVYLVKLTPLSHFRLALEFADGACGIFTVLDNDFLGDRLSFLRSEEYFALASIKSGPVLCYDYADDLALLLDLLDGPLPDCWAHENIGAQLDRERQEAYFREHGGRHRALHDARANAFAFGGEA